MKLLRMKNNAYILQIILQLEISYVSITLNKYMCDENTFSKIFDLILLMLYRKFQIIPCQRINIVDKCNEQ